jgi:threonine synthase
LYASHVENPFFTDGTKAWSFEVWEQLGDAPARVVMSVGNGSLLIGAYLGFRYLLEHGYTTRMPEMIAAQAQGWSVLSNDLSHGDEGPLADGIAIVAPRRYDQIMKIVEETGGQVRTVANDDIRSTHAALARRGLWVEPTSAVAWAAAEQSAEYDGDVVVSLGGAGFKAAGA